jgi:Protein of unknown function (DUF3102)
MPQHAVMRPAGQKAYPSNGLSETSPKFDYANVPKSVASFLQGESERIRRQYTHSVVQIGKALLGSKRYLSHGSFIAWVEAEVGMPARTAQAYMRVAQWASGKSAIVAHLPPAVLYLLSASSTPPDLARAIIERVDAGERMSFVDLRKELRDHRQAQINTIQHRELSKEPPTLTVRGMEFVSLLEEAISIIARELSESDFLRVESAFTDRYLTADPSFAEHVTSMFSKVRGSLEK